MNRQILRSVLGVVAIMVLSGCYTVRTYMVNKPRVDQDIPGQPAGATVKTRKVAVLEVVEKDKDQPIAVQDEGRATFVPPPSGKENNFTLPQSNVPAAKSTAAAPSADAQDYVVQKDDTLQKIAKKVYGSYSKWTRIYDANREIIKDPNFLKPGITLKIPVLQESVQPTTQP